MGTPLRVLLIEDSEDDAFLVMRELEHEGFRAVFKRVESADALAQALDTGTWDVVLCDYSMPGFNGIAALNLLRERNLDVPFILVSGTVGEEIAVQAMKAGAQDYIMKGNLKRLSAAVARELKDAEMRRARRRAEDGLRESQRVLLTLMSNLPGMAYRCRNDRDFTMEFVSEGCVKLTGYHSAELIGNYKVAYAQLIHPEDRERVWQEVQTAVRERAPYQIVYRIISRSAETKRVWGQGCGVFTPQGSLQSLEGFVSEVTQLKL